MTFAALGLPPFVPQVELWVDGRLMKVTDGWYPSAALAIEFDGRVKYQRARYGRAPADELWREKRTEDLLRSVGVRFVRVVAEDMTAARRDQLEGLVRRHLTIEGPRVREFSEVPRTEAHWRGGDTGDDGWLSRADDGVGTPRPG